MYTTNGFLGTYVTALPKITWKCTKVYPQSRLFRLLCYSHPLLYKLLCTKLHFQFLSLSKMASYYQQYPSEAALIVESVLIYLSVTIFYR